MSLTTTSPIPTDEDARESDSFASMLEGLADDLEGPNWRHMANALRAGADALRRSAVSASPTITYEHEYDYSYMNEDGSWSEPEVRYTNATQSRECAEIRHESCRDYECVFGHKFEGIYGYRWANCRLVKRTVTVIETVESLDLKDSK